MLHSFSSDIYVPNDIPGHINHDTEVTDPRDVGIQIAPELSTDSSPNSAQISQKRILQLFARYVKAGCEGFIAGGAAGVYNWASSYHERFKILIPIGYETPFDEHSTGALAFSNGVLACALHGVLFGIMGQTFMDTGVLDKWNRWFEREYDDETSIEDTSAHCDSITLRYISAGLEGFVIGAVAGQYNWESSFHQRHHILIPFGYIQPPAEDRLKEFVGFLNIVLGDALHGIAFGLSYQVLSDIEYFKKWNSLFNPECILSKKKLSKLRRYIKSSANGFAIGIIAGFYNWASSYHQRFHILIPIEFISPEDDHDTGFIALVNGVLACGLHGVALALSEELLKDCGVLKSWNKIFRK